MPKTWDNLIPKVCLASYQSNLFLNIEGKLEIKIRSQEKLEFNRLIIKPRLNNKFSFYKNKLTGTIKLSWIIRLSLSTTVLLVAQVRNFAKCAQKPNTLHRYAHKNTHTKVGKITWRRFLSIEIFGVHIRSQKCTQTFSLGWYLSKLDAGAWEI